MMRSLMILMLMVCISLSASAAEKVIAVFPTDVLPSLAQDSRNPPGVTISLDSAVILDSKASIKVVYTGNTPIDVMLFAVEKLPMMENCALEYAAALRSEGTTGKAFLAMWVKFPDGKSYFSRGMNQAITGTQDWLRCMTPFFLKKGEIPASATLGVRFEGPGTVWINNARLVENYQEPFSNPRQRGALLGILGGGLGGIIGMWGALVGILAPRGKGKRFLMASGILFLAIGLLLLVGGLYCLVAGFPWDIWYALLLSGGITTVVIGPILWVLRARYHLVETQRLHAQDQAENL